MQHVAAGGKRVVLGRIVAFCYLCSQLTMNMKIYDLSLRVASAELFKGGTYVLLKLTHEQPLPPMLPGQFVQVRVEQAPHVLLRRPISIHYVDRTRNELWLLVHGVGEGTRALCRLQAGARVDCLLPLGNGFTSASAGRRERVLCVGGGVGTAPMLFLGSTLRNQGSEPVFLLGARSAADLLELDVFRTIGSVYITTEDGTLGERGFVTNHSRLGVEHFDRICVCGPKPMMVAVARWAHTHKVPCEVSLENLMACGLGACLCCVEKMKDGHNLRVCKEGPVFNVNQLSWPI